MPDVDGRKSSLTEYSISLSVIGRNFGDLESQTATVTFLYDPDYTGDVGTGEDPPPGAPCGGVPDKVFDLSIVGTGFGNNGANLVWEGELSGSTGFTVTDVENTSPGMGYEGSGWQNYRSWIRIEHAGTIFPDENFGSPSLFPGGVTTFFSGQDVSGEWTLEPIDPPRQSWEGEASPLHPSGPAPRTMSIRIWGVCTAETAASDLTN